VPPVGGYAPRVSSAGHPAPRHEIAHGVRPCYFETMTQTPKTTLPANAKAATAASTM
jgi:hypothetical protein